MTLPVILFKKSKLQNLPEHSTAVKWKEAKDLKNGRLGAVLHEFKRLEVGSSWWETWRECCQTMSLVSMYYSPVPDDHVDTTSLEIQKKEGFTTINFTDNFFESKNLGESLDRRTTCNYMRVRKLLGSLNQKMHNLYKAISRVSSLIICSARLHNWRFCMLFEPSSREDMKMSYRVAKGLNSSSLFRHMYKIASYAG